MKAFYSTKKALVGVDFTHFRWSKQPRKVLDSAFLYLRTGVGTSAFLASVAEANGRAMEKGKGAREHQGVGWVLACPCSCPWWWHDEQNDEAAGEEERRGASAFVAAATCTSQNAQAYLLPW